MFSCNRYLKNLFLLTFITAFAIILSLASFVRAEAEYYWDNFTLAGHGGWQGGNNVLDSGWGGGSFLAYITEYFVLQAGFQLARDVIFFAEAEWQPGLGVAPGLTLFASIAGLDDDYEHTMLGARYYFGATKSLMKRHREDDPANNLFKGMVLNLQKFGETAPARPIPN